MLKPEEVERELEAEQQKLEESQQRVRRIKEAGVIQSLTLALDNLDDVKARIEKLESLYAIKEQVDGVQASLDKIIALLGEYVADNKRAVDGINKYLSDWK